MWGGPIGAGTGLLAKLIATMDTRPPHPDPSETAVAYSPNNPPWGSGTAFSVWVLSVLFIVFVPAVFLLPYVALKFDSATMGPFSEFARTDPTAILIQIGGVVPAHLLTLLIAWMVATRGRRLSLKETVGLDPGGFRWWHYCIILGAFLAVAGVVSSYFPEQEHDLERLLRSSRSVVYAVAFVATFTAPAAEEIVYRGLLYSAFQRSMGVPAAFILVTTLFVVVHVPQYYPSYSTIFLLTLLSMILTAIRVRTGSLLPCIILHTVFNGLQSLVLILWPLAPKPEALDPAGIFTPVFTFADYLTNL